MNRHASRLLAMARRWLGVDARDRTLDAELNRFFSTKPMHGSTRA